MLIEFSVGNFRSFAEEQRFSMSAGRFKSERIGAIIEAPSKATPHLLRAAAIMGANGSGKSSFIGALAFLQEFVSNSAQSTQLGDKIDVTPFRLDSELSKSPSSFEIIFIFEDVEYTYSFSVSREMVHQECLFSRAQKGPLRQVFTRIYADDGERWELSALPKGQARVWRKSTRPNALFLSTAVQLNSEELAKPFHWLTKNLKLQGANESFSASHTSHLIKEHVDDGCKTEVMNLLRQADLGIKNVVIEEEDFDESVLPVDLPEEIRRRVIADLKGKKFQTARFVHKGRDAQDVIFDFDDESDGTQRLFEMAGPLISSIRHDYTLVVDELESSLHSYLVRLIVSMFQKPGSQTNAQLIFTTHNDGLLDSNMLERDQFWFVEKRAGQSELFALIDYKPRKGEALRVNYLKGRYGGVPAIAQLER